MEETINDIAMRALISMGSERKSWLWMTRLATLNAAVSLSVTDPAIILAAEAKVILAAPHLYNFAKEG